MGRHHSLRSPEVRVPDDHDNQGAVDTRGNRECESAAGRAPGARPGRRGRMNVSTDGPVAWCEPTLVISLDLELAWGSFDHAYGPELLAMARWTHDHGAPTLLEQLTRNGLSATWAVVGAVMLDRLPDPKRLEPFSIPGGRDWFSFVPPGATEQTAPEWFGASF